MGTLLIGLDSATPTSAEPEAHRSAGHSGRQRHRVRLVLARGLRAAAEVLERPIGREPAR